MEGFILRDFIVKWNNLFILDRWYRKKYNIPFNSSQHRELSPLDIRFEFEEELFFKAFNKKNELRTKALEEYKEDGKLFDKNAINKPMTQEEIDEAFDNIDLDALNKNLNNKSGE